MSDPRLPVIPSLAELGISESDIKAIEGVSEPDREDLPKETSRPPPPIPWRGMRGPATLLILVAAAFLSSSLRLPAAGTADLPDSAFSSGRAMSHVERIASRPRPPGSPGHADALEYILAELRALGLEPAVQTTTSMRSAGPSLTAAAVRNVVARLPGTASSGRAVLVTAHYDSRGISPGAADDGIGVAAILESLRALATGPRLANDLIVLVTDAEELGLLGARAFVDEHPWMEDVALVISIEMRGGGGPAMMFETGPENGWVVRAFAEASPRPVANSIGIEIYRRMPNDTDFTPFREAGVQGLNFAGIGRANVYHQATDTPGNLDERTLQHHGIQTLAMLRHFGDASLDAVRSPNASYLTLPLVGVVVYGKLWVWLLGAVVVALWLAAFAAARRVGLRIAGVLTGLGVYILSVTAIGVGASLLFRWGRGVHPEYGALLAGSFHSEGWYVLALAGASFALVALLTAALGRRFAAAELATGALAPSVMATSVATAFFPMAAVNLQWPALAGCLAALAVARLPRGRAPGHLQWVATVPAAVVVVAVMTPLVEGVWLAMGMRMAPVVAGLATVAFLFVLPLLAVLAEPNRWWLPTLGVLAAGCCLALGIRSAEPSSDRPAPSTLVYLMDRESGKASWGTNPAHRPPDPGAAWVASSLGPFGASLEAPERYTPARIPYALRPAELLDAPPPEVTSMPDSAVPHGTARVSVASAIGAEMLLLDLSEVGPRLVALNGKRVPGGVRTLRVEHWGAPEGEGGGLVLDFDVAAGGGGEAGADTAGRGGAFALSVVEHHLRPADLFEQDHFARPEHLAPNVRLLSDRAMIRTLYSVEAASGRVAIVTPGSPWMISREHRERSGTDAAPLECR